MIDLDALQDAAEAANADPDGRDWEAFWDELSEDVILELVAAHRAALARIAKVEALHTSEGWPLVGGGESKDYCTRCDCRWPCPTVLALEGEEDGR